MYEIIVETTFAAAHAIRLSETVVEPVHGHNWPLKVTVASDELDSIETVMDFHILETTINGLIEKVHNRHLNEVKPFGVEKGDINPTAERVAWWFGSEVAKTLPKGVRMVSASVGEAPGCTAIWRP